MPFLSRAQQRWGHTPAGMKALGGAAAVAEWDSATKGRRVPERKGGKPKKRRVFGSLSPHSAGHYMGDMPE